MKILKHCNFTLLSFKNEIFICVHVHILSAGVEWCDGRDNIDKVTTLLSHQYQSQFSDRFYLCPVCITFQNRWMDGYLKNIFVSLLLENFVVLYLLINRLPLEFSHIMLYSAEILANLQMYSCKNRTHIPGDQNIAGFREILQTLQLLYCSRVGCSQLQTVCRSNSAATHFQVFILC